MIRRLFGASSIVLGVFFVLWFFMGIAYLVMDLRRRGAVEMGIVASCLAIGVGLIALGYGGVRR